MIDFIIDNRQHFFYLLIILVALGFYYTVNRLQYNPMGRQFTVEGTIIDIHQTKDNTTLLIENDDGPIYVAFRKKIGNVQLLDEVLIHTNGIVLDSYPSQTTGFVNKNKYRQGIIELEHQQFFIESPEPFFEESDFSYYRFQQKNLTPEELSLLIDDVILEDNQTIVLSWIQLSKTATLTFNNFMQKNDTLYLLFNIESTNNNEMIYKGVITIIDNENHTITLANYISK